MMSSGCDCLSEAEGFQYELRNNSATGGVDYINMITAYPLPEHRTKNFLDTMILLMTNTELKTSARFNIEYMGNSNSNSNNTPLFYSGFHNRVNGVSEAINVTVEDNNNYSSSLTDPKDVNYYTKIIAYNETIEGAYTMVKVYLRQDLEPTTAISYMIMTKPLNGASYEYVGHAFLNQLSVTSAYVGIPQPLPDILK